MADFQRAFNEFLNTDPAPTLIDPESGLAPHTFDDTSEYEDWVGTSGKPFLHSEFYIQGVSNLSDDPVNAKFDEAAFACVADPDGAERELDEMRNDASSKPHVVLTKLSAFGEILKGVVQRFRRLPDRLSGVLEKFQEVVKAIAKAFKTVSYSITINLPWSLSFGFSWN